MTKKKKRLIDADDFMKVLQRTNADVCADFGNGFAEFGYSRTLIRLLLSETPTVGTTEVVLCRECKYRDGTPGQPNILCGQMHDDDFCSYGERKSQ